jgi:hypothetical protein
MDEIDIKIANSNSAKWDECGTWNVGWGVAQARGGSGKVRKGETHPSHIMQACSDEGEEEG